MNTRQRWTLILTSVASLMATLAVLPSTSRDPPTARTPDLFRIEADGHATSQ